MFISSDPNSLAARSFSVLRSVGAWVAIHPEQTYVATSIRGLGACKSTYCRAERRELPSPVWTGQVQRRLAPLLAAAVAAIGLLSSCATYRPLVDMRDVTDRDQYERDLADCQNYAEPVSPGASAGAGAIFGAILGAALGAAVGDHHVTVDAARFGAVEGAVAGGAAGAGTQVQIIRNCMNGRGYVVLN
jgi:outer membrane lipoprotein SlyB